MKRSSVFAVAGACALGLTAMVGGIGYASGVDVAEQAGRTLDLRGVSTSEKTQKPASESDTLAESDAATEDASADAPVEEAPVTEAPVVGAPVTEVPVVEEPVGEIPVEVVEPSEPVVLPEQKPVGDATKDGEHAGKNGDRLGWWRDGAWNRDDKRDCDPEHHEVDPGVTEPSAVDPSSGEKSWQKPAPAPAPAPAPEQSTRDGWGGHGGGHGDTRGGHGGGDRGGWNDGDRGGDRGDRGGDRGHGGGRR